MPCLCVFHFDNSLVTCRRVQTIKLPFMQYLTDLICHLTEIQLVPYANHLCFSWLSNVRTVVISFLNAIVDTNIIILIRKCPEIFLPVKVARICGSFSAFVASGFSGFRVSTGVLSCSIFRSDNSVSMIACLVSRSTVDLRIREYCWCYTTTTNRKFGVCDWRDQL